MAIWRRGKKLRPKVRRSLVVTRVGKPVPVRRIPMRVLEDMSRFVVFSRDRFTCIRCGRKCTEVEYHDNGHVSYHGIQWAHVHTRGVKHLKFDSDNIMTLCRGCHMWWHGRLPPFHVNPMRWWEELYPQRAKRLTLILQTLRQRGRVDYGAVYVMLKLEVERIEKLQKGGEAVDEREAGRPDCVERRAALGRQPDAGGGRGSRAHRVQGHARRNLPDDVRAVGEAVTEGTMESQGLKPGDKVGVTKPDGTSYVGVVREMDRGTGPFEVLVQKGEDGELNEFALVSGEQVTLRELVRSDETQPNATTPTVLPTDDDGATPPQPKDPNDIP